jgi:hypothetical protein
MKKVPIFLAGVITGIVLSMITPIRPYPVNPLVVPQVQNAENAIDQATNTVINSLIK